MARSIWIGSISFGLISIPIKLFTAVRHKGVSFNQLDDRTMSRIRYQKVSEADDEVVPAEHIVKGVEISKGRYVIVDPDELAPFVPLATKSIDVEQFVDLTEIDPVLFESTYYVAPHLTTNTVRTPGQGAGVGRQGGDRAVRDAQPPVHRSTPRRRRTPDDVHPRLRRRTGAGR